MSLITWNDYFVTGIDEIDSQHRWLIDLINRAAPVLVLPYESAHAMADELLDALTQYVIFHFQTEERLMNDHGIDHRHSDHHLRVHAGFAARVGEMRQRYDRDRNITAGGDLLTFLANWLIFHILADDQVLGRQLRAIRAGKKPDEAFEDAEGKESDPAQRAQTQALIDLYQLINIQYANLQAANQELELHRGRLEELVSKRTAQLAEARDQAEAASRAKSAFLANMSHEFRTPLNAIVGMDWALLQQVSDPAQREKLRLIARASGRLLGMLDDVLDMVKLESGELTPEPVDFSPRMLIERQSANLREQAAARSLSVSVEVAEPLPEMLHADASRIEQIVSHLIDNAVKFTAEGRIVLRAGARQAPTDDGHAGWSLGIEIEDSGCGIEPTQLANLFHPFAQADTSTTRAHGGTGLGLALCKRLALLLAGDIEVQSAPGLGSRFRLQVPATLITGQARMDTARPLPAAPAGPVAEVATLSPAERTAAGELLYRLRTLAAEDDSRALSLWHESAALLTTILGARTTRIEHALASYDFETALTALDEALAELNVPPATGGE